MEVMKLMENTLPRCVMQRGRAIRVGAVEVCTRCKQRPHRAQLAAARCKDKRSHTIVTLRIRICSSGEEPVDRSQCMLSDDVMQRCGSVARLVVESV